MIPFEVPRTMADATAKQVGVPKFLFPASENTCSLSFLNLVQRTTSHGGDGVSVSAGWSRNWLLNETVRLWPGTGAGDEGRGEERNGEAIRDRNRWSKGLKEGVGLETPRRADRGGCMPLLGDDITEPYGRLSAYPKLPSEPKQSSPGQIPVWRACRLGCLGSSQKG